MREPNLAGLATKEGRDLEDSQLDRIAHGGEAGVRIEECALFTEDVRKTCETVKRRMTEDRSVA